MAGFAPAVKSQAKARIGLYGVGGSGKTMAALLIARGLVPGGRVALVDCEAGKSSSYADDFPFDTIILPPPYTPVRFKWCIDQAVAGAYDVLIFDGISPFWSGTGGILAIVDAAKKRGGGWSDGSPAQQQIIDSITGCPMHIIVTMRAKSDTIVDKENGKTSIKKIGMKYDQRDNVEYDLGWLLYLEHGTHAMTIEKTHMIGQEGKTYLPVEGSPEQPAEEFGREIATWLGTGAAIPEPAPPAPAPPVAPTPEPTPAPPAPAAAPPAPTPAAPLPEAPEAGSVPQAAPSAGITLVQQTTIDAQLAELTKLRPDNAWEGTILGKVKDWYGVDSFEALTEANAAQVIERLTTTTMKVVEANKTNTTEGSA